MQPFLPKTRSLHHALLLGLCILGCIGLAATPKSEAARPFDHSALSELLGQYVNSTGLVDYDGLKQDVGKLDAYLETLAGADLEPLSEAEQLAFWINAYNAYAIKLVVESMPVSSIMEAPEKGFITGSDDPFEAAFADVAGETYSLNQIENEVIRKQFDEPRIHFAVNCAAQSCPRLRSEAYTGDALDEQLEEEARYFLLESGKNKILADDATIRLSKVFEWYGEDFGSDNAEIQAYLAPYFEGDVKKKLGDGAYDVAFLEYDWSLNAQ